MFVDLRGELAGLGLALIAEGEVCAGAIGRTIDAVCHGALEGRDIPAVDLDNHQYWVMEEDLDTEKVELGWKERLDATHEIPMESIAGRITVGEDERLLVTPPLILEQLRAIIHLIKERDEMLRVASGTATTIVVPILRIHDMRLVIGRV